MMTRAALTTLLACALAWSASAATPQDLESARRDFDLDRLAQVESELLTQAREQKDDFDAQYWAAEACRLHATALRNQRYIHELRGKEEDAVREEQAKLAEAGLPFAEQAIALAANTHDKAQAHRAAGELYTHLISGMISGMRNGPKAKRHVEQALELESKDPECRRAIAIMYLHNPKFNGGDVPRAIETFEELSKAHPSSDVYRVLLAMAYRKADRIPEARKAARDALAVNAGNEDAKALLEETN